jgi:hypothetical protein
MKTWRAVSFVILAGFCLFQQALAQALGEPDRGQPGDRMIQEYLRRHTEDMHASFAGDLESLAAWRK